MWKERRLKIDFYGWHLIISLKKKIRSVFTTKDENDEVIECLVGNSKRLVSILRSKVGGGFGKDGIVRTNRNHPPT